MTETCLHPELKRRLVLWWSADPLYEVVCEDCGFWGGLVREKEPNKRVTPE